MFAERWLECIAYAGLSAIPPGGGLEGGFRMNAILAPIQLDLEARVDRFAFECEHGEGAFVHFAQRRSSDEPFESFDAE